VGWVFRQPPEAVLKTIAIALSGGIDSAVSAYLLKQEGYRVLALHADFGLAPQIPLSRLEKITDFLQIPLTVLSLKSAFQEKVLDYFISAYASGRTPNPCVVCNQSIKFDLLYGHGQSLGAEGLATGHYARIVAAPWSQGLTIARGLDSSKDQSYFLHRLKAAELDRFRFPLGTWTKKRVRTLAGDIGLPAPDNEESQDICFLPRGGYREFLQQHLDPALSRPGDIVDLQGKVLGGHQGIYAYTVGQRRGLGIPGPEPYYVLRLEAARRRVVIGPRSALESSACRLSQIRLFRSPAEIDGREVSVQIRYRHIPVRASLRLEKEDGARLHFHSPQKAVTPGQAAVFFSGEFLLGGGWIEEAWK
jgi:tRNA-uridine 2-sulfurtransferase